MKMVSEEDEADLASAPTDEDIAEVFNFEEAKSVDIQVIAEFDKDPHHTQCTNALWYCTENAHFSEVFAPRCMC